MCKCVCARHFVCFRLRLCDASLTCAYVRVCCAPLFLLSLSTSAALLLHSPRFGVAFMNLNGKIAVDTNVKRVTRTLTVAQ